MGYVRITPDQLRHLARLVETGLADGEFSVEMERESYIGGVENRYTLRNRSYGDRYTIEVTVNPNAAGSRRNQEIVDRLRDMVPVMIIPIDRGPSIDLLVNIIKTIVRAWASDVVTDNMIRYSLLEL